MKKPETAEHDRPDETEISTAWRTVELSRHPSRPYTQDYLDRIFSAWTEVKGDRVFREDRALIAGIGALKSTKSLPNGLTVAFVGHQKGRKTKEKIDRNFGMPHPEGYRKAQRVYALAKRFNLPLITLVDTPGAYPGIGAEERGQSEAIAHSIYDLVSLDVPTVSVIIGEGGSGGALALACTDVVLMFKNSIYSVISPESCAAILWSDSGRAKEAAVSLRSAAFNLKEFGLCDQLIEVDFPDAGENGELMISTLHQMLADELKRLLKMSPESRMKKRFDRYRSFDARYMTGLK